MRAALAALYVDITSTLISAANSELLCLDASQAAGLDRNMPRKDWPQEILRGVLVELIRETPTQLLAREMWCSSTGSADWWESQKRFSRSLAFMSMVGTSAPPIHRAGLEQLVGSGLAMRLISTAGTVGLAMQCSVDVTFFQGIGSSARVPWMFTSAIRVGLEPGLMPFALTNMVCMAKQLSLGGQKLVVCSIFSM